MALTMGQLGKLVEELNLSFSSEYSKEELEGKIICRLEWLAKCSFEKLAKASTWDLLSLRSKKATNDESAFGAVHTPAVPLTHSS